MAKFFFIFPFLLILCFSDEMIEQRWTKGETFLGFLEKNDIPRSLYYNLQKEDQELAAEILSDVKFQILYDNNREIRQVLIPVGDEMQIHLYKNSRNEFVFTTTPIIYMETNNELSLKIEKSPYQDIKSFTNNSYLANEFSTVFKSHGDLKQLRKGDELIIFYKERRRLGKIFSSPQINAALVNSRKQRKAIYLFEDGRYYDKSGKEMENFFLIKPLGNARVSSPFSYKRWHPILKRYRAHLGIDYAAPKGTPIKAAGDGRVSFVGRKGGYGKTVIIAHKDGYRTLYAHANGYAKNIKSGTKVKKGQIIAYVGTTGASTGPHLHFGLYKNNRAIDPSKVVKIAKNSVTGTKKAEFLKIVKKFDKKFEESLKETKIPKLEENFDNYISLGSGN